MKKLQLRKATAKNVKESKANGKFVYYKTKGGDIRGGLIEKEFNSATSMKGENSIFLPYDIKKGDRVVELDTTSGETIIQKKRLLVKKLK